MCYVGKSEKKIASMISIVSLFIHQWKYDNDKQDNELISNIWSNITYHIIRMSRTNGNDNFNDDSNYYDENQERCQL